MICQLTESKTPIHQSRWLYGVQMDNAGSAELKLAVARLADHETGKRHLVAVPDWRVAGTFFLGHGLLDWVRRASQLEAGANPSASPVLVERARGGESHRRSSQRR